MPTDYKYNWSSEAIELLGKRDRFTRAAIRKDFEADPELFRVTLDAEEALYATPVADNRYAVIWKVLANNLAEVKAVVASQLRGEGGPELKRKLEQVVDVESHGQIKL